MLLDPSRRGLHGASGVFRCLCRRLELEMLLPTQGDRAHLVLGSFCDTRHATVYGAVPTGGRPLRLSIATFYTTRGIGEFTRVYTTGGLQFSSSTTRHLILTPPWLVTPCMPGRGACRSHGMASLRVRCECPGHRVINTVPENTRKISQRCSGPATGTKMCHQ